MKTKAGVEWRHDFERHLEHLTVNPKVFEDYNTVYMRKLDQVVSMEKHRMLRDLPVIFKEGLLSATASKPEILLLERHFDIK